MILEIGTKEILNKTRTNFALKQKQTLLSFLVIMIFRGLCVMGGGGGGGGESRGLYGDYLKEATTIILKPPTLKATRYMCIVLDLDKNVQMY